MMPLNPLNLFVLTLIPLALSLHSPILNEPETNTTTYYHTTAPYKILLGPTYPRVCNVSTTDSPHIEDFELLFQALVKEGNKRHRQYMDDVGPLSNLIDKLVDPDSEAPSDVPDTGVSYGCRVFKQLMYRGIGIEMCGPLGWTVTSKELADSWLQLKRCLTEDSMEPRVEGLRILGVDAKTGPRWIAIKKTPCYEPCYAGMGPEWPVGDV